MLKFWKTFRYVALGGVALQFWGCGSGWWKQLLIDGVTFAGLEFLTDNNGIFDLFTDN